MSTEMARRDTGDKTPAYLEALKAADPSSLPFMQVDELAEKPQEFLVAAGGAFAREYAQIKHRETLLLKQMASILVALRVQVGDLTGTSYAYRQIVGEMYRASGEGPETLEPMKTAVRWHVQNLLRRVMTSRELREKGLLETTPLERARDLREANAAILAGIAAAASAEESSQGRALGRKGSEVKATADLLRLARAAHSLVTKMNSGVVEQHMTSGQLEALDAEMAAMQTAMAALRRRLKKAKAAASE
ncbi:hypothetical protein [Streptomyces sp. NPDC020141]|uniref:hypothetical protein n=1 Tax=Streptomyces sp. NPDC020141 TaxID=3365065 RepID=UPI0037B63D29